MGLCIEGHLMSLFIRSSRAKEGEVFMSEEEIIELIKRELLLNVEEGSEILWRDGVSRYIQTHKIRLVFFGEIISEVEIP